MILGGREEGRWRAERERSDDLHIGPQQRGESLRQQASVFHFTRAHTSGRQGGKGQERQEGLEREYDTLKACACEGFLAVLRRGAVFLFFRWPSASPGQAGAALLVPA
jgi:hypothetical protein